MGCGDFKWEGLNLRRLSLALLLLSGSACFAQSKSIDPAARKDIDAGNQIWIAGMKSGDVASIAAVFAEDALNCGESGECERGQSRD